MPGKRDGEITRLLGAFSNGELEAEARLMELTYRELRKIAAGHMRRERSARSLQTTDLVHEAYLRLVEQADTPWRDRAHFFQVAAHVMRQILIDRARKRHAGKRGGGGPEISLDRHWISPKRIPGTCWCSKRRWRNCRKWMAASARW